MKALKFALLVFFSSIVASSVAAAYVPEQVTEAMRHGDVRAAEQMQRSILNAQPGDARAHYDMGQIYGAEGRHNEALSELLTAQKIDPTMSFARSPDLFAKKLATEQSLVVSATPELVAKSNSHTGLWIFILLAVVAIFAFIIWRIRTTPKVIDTNDGSYGSTVRTVTPPIAPSGGQSASQAPNNSTYYNTSRPQQQTFVQPSPSPVIIERSSGMDGFVAGAVVGSLLSDHHDHGSTTIVNNTTIDNNDVERYNSLRSNRSSDYDDSNSYSRRRNSDSYASSNSNSDSGYSSYDSGSSSSSYDSGSSSSSYDSGSSSSSYDSGSSGGSDW